MLQVLRRALTKWRRLPPSRRRPGAVRVGERGPVDPRYHRQPPADGAVVNVYTRILERASDGTWRRGRCSVAGADHAARDHLWLTREDIDELLTPSGAVGSDRRMPRRLFRRILRYHLVDNTRGEPPFWRPEQVRSAVAQLRLIRLTEGQIAWQLDGHATMATAADFAKAKRGYQVRLTGFIELSRPRRQVTRFDLVAVGDHWGEGKYTRNARPGKTPLGVAFVLAPTDDPGRNVPPQGARDLYGYLRPK